MIEKLTRSLVVIERETYEAEKRAPTIAAHERDLRPTP